MMQQPVEERRHRGGVAEQFAPVFDGAIRREDRRRALVAAHHEFQQILAGGVGQFAHPEIIDDEERDGSDVGEVGFACAGDRGVGEFLEQRVRFPVQDAIALLNRRVADRLG